MDVQISNLFKAISERDEMIMGLEQRITLLEQKHDLLNSIMFVWDRVIENLRLELTRVQQYTRRPNVSILGIPKDKKETHEQLKEKISNLISEVGTEVSMANIDKFHRDGPSFGDEQSVIIRFKSHEFKETFYKEGRKKLKGNRSGIKIKPNLCQERKNLLNLPSILWIPTHRISTILPILRMPMCMGISKSKGNTGQRTRCFLM